MRAQVTCVIEKGDPPFTINWLKDAVLITPTLPLASEIKIIPIDSRSSTFVIESLSARHSGNFTCLASNGIAEVAHTAPLTVSGKIQLL